jgi:phage head maturation protease
MSEQIVKFTILKESKQIDNGEKVFYFKITDDSIDRDKDIIIPSGIDVSKYLDNPVVLFAHNFKGMPIGKTVSIDTENMIAGIVFADTEEGRTVKYLVENGFLNAVSIGFIAKKIYDKYGFFASFEQLKEDMPEWYNANKDKLLEAERVIAKAELMEISVVPVPANPNAVVVMRSKGIDNICTFGCSAEGKTVLVDIPLSEDVLEIKNAVSYSVHPKNMKKDTTSSWDKKKAIESLRKWASSDGSGDKDKINWVKYRKGFAWYDANAIDNFTSYKYPHHWVENGDFYVVWRGVASAMAYFMAYKENLPADDRKGVYNHLARHYREDFGKEPPEYKEGKYSIKEAIEKFDKDTLEEYIKLFDVNELISEIKSIMEEEVKFEKELEEIKQKYSKLSKELEEIKSLLQNISSESSPPSGVDKSEDSEEKSVDSERISSKGSEEVKIKVNPDEVKTLIKQIIENQFKKGGNDE